MQDTGKDFGIQNRTKDIEAQSRKFSIRLRGRPYQQSGENGEQEIMKGRAIYIFPMMKKDKSSLSGGMIKGTQLNISW